jgi:uncharacterized membrane protein YedE/YeeE
MLSALWLFRLVATLPDSGMSPGLRTVLLAGLPVGYRTCLESGRASGHCVCGLCRSSPRSLLATACRMGAGFATVYVVRHLLSG